jgi:hypothetical protein
VAKCGICGIVAFCGILIEKMPQNKKYKILIIS